MKGSVFAQSINRVKKNLPEAHLEALDLVIQCVQVSVSPVAQRGQTSLWVDV